MKPKTLTKTIVTESLFRLAVFQSRGCIWCKAIYLFFAFAQAVLPSLPAVGGGNDEKPLRQEIPKCRHTAAPQAISLNMMVRL